MNKEIMKACGFQKEVEKVEQGICPFCDSTVCDEDFQDDLSRKEFAISGLCQKCQNSVFKED